MLAVNIARNVKFHIISAMAAKIAGLAIVLIGVAIAGSLWIEKASNDKTGVPYAQANTSLNDQRNVSKTATDTVWATYTDEVYQFSIKYPCDSACEHLALPQTVTAESAEHRVTLPTRDSRVFIDLAGFAQAAFESGRTESGLGDAAPYSLSKIRAALELAVGSRCEVYYSPPTNISDELCSVATLGGEKAIQLLVRRRFGNNGYSYISYFVPRGGDLWLEIDESYENGGALLVGPTSTDPYLAPQIAAATDVIKTLTFAQ